MKKYDKHIQEKIESLAEEKVPNIPWNAGDTWEKLNQKLEEESKDRKIIPLFYRKLSVAASILIFLSLGLYLFFVPKASKNEHIATSKKEVIQPEIKEKTKINIQELDDKIKKQEKTLKISEENTRNLVSQQSDKKKNKSEMIESEDPKIKRASFAVVNLSTETMAETTKSDLEVSKMKPIQDKQVILLKNAKTKGKFNFGIALGIRKKDTEIQTIVPKERTGTFRLGESINFQEQATDMPEPPKPKVRIKLIK